VRRKELLRPNGPLCSENLLPKPIPHNYHSRLTWRVHRVLPGFFESGQRAGCSDELAQVKQRFSFGLLHGILLFLNLGFASQKRGLSAHEKQMPFMVGESA